MIGALNFKDVMLAYGKLPIDMMEDGAVNTPIGFEFAGTVSLVGQVPGSMVPFRPECITSCLYTMQILLPKFDFCRDRAVQPLLCSHIS